MDVPGGPSQDTKWHALSAEDVLAQLNTSSEAGLTQEEAVQRVKQYGPNALTPPPKPSFLRRLWNQINT